MQDSALRKAFGGRVKALRKQRHWTRKALANKVDIRYQLLNKYESGQHIPPAETLIRLAEALDTTVDYLLTGNPVKDSPLADSMLFKRFKTLETFGLPFLFFASPAAGATIAGGTAAMAGTARVAPRRRVTASRPPADKSGARAPARGSPVHRLSHRV